MGTDDFYPFLYASVYGNGTTLRSVVNCERFSTDNHLDAPYLVTSVIYNEEAGEIVVYAVNRSMTEEMELDVSLESFGECHLMEHIELYSEDLKAVNRRDYSAVLPHAVDFGEKIILKKHSWNMLKFTC